MSHSSPSRPKVSLTGQLICADDSEREIVSQHLAQHIELTRAEPGCVSFRVEQTSNPLVWQVDEQFTDADAFASHQARVKSSDWGQVTAAIERHYEIRGLDDAR